ncbi:MAG: DUF2892 domain-containing protein [Candidatus Uhrbacteria bacterium]|nr:DUF2892 domain-containing protein [Candidatus Uhrbacteria bacterium]
MENEANLQEELKEFEEIDVGEALVSWDSFEFPQHDRSKVWYIVTAIVGVALIVYAIASANYLFAIIVLMMGIILLVNGLHQPDQIMVHITDQGVVVGDEFFAYEEIKDFSLIYKPPHTKILYIDFISLWKPLLTIPLEESNPNVVREVLLQYAFENLEREDETLTDLFRRLYKM